MNLHNLMIQFAFLYAPLMHVPTEEITPYIYRGPDPHMKDIYVLHDKGIKTIISLRTNPQRKKERLCRKLGMKWILIKTGVFMTPTAEQLDQFRTIVNDKSNQPVYTSCEINMDRTAVYLSAWRRVDQHWSQQQVEDDLHKHHMKTWWPIFRKYERVVNNYSDAHQTAVADTGNANAVVRVSERTAESTDMQVP